MSHDGETNGAVPVGNLPRYRQIGREIEACIKSGNFFAAGILALDALTYGPEHPTLLNLAGFAKLQWGETDEAIALLTRARKLSPRDVNILNSLGNALKRARRLESAAEAFGAAIAAEPGFAIAHYNKGTILEDLGDHAGARAAYERAATIRPDYADPLVRLSFLAAMDGDYDRALLLGKRVPQRSARPVGVEVSELALGRGDKEAAKRFAALALKEEPSPASALALAKAERELGDHQAAMRLAQQVLSGQVTAVERAVALQALGDAKEGLGDFAGAFEAYAASKAETRRAFAPQFAPPAVESYAARTERAIEYFAHAPAELWRTGSSPAPDLPGGLRGHSFLFGFARSGTTLLEQALASHSGVASAEETEALADVITDFFNVPNGWAKLAQANEGLLRVYRDAYWRSTRAVVPALEGKVLLDKHPLNTVLLGAVAKLFPSAKILFAIRDPRDVVLSCFRHQFAVSAGTYEFCDLVGTARFYDAVMRLAEIQRQQLALPIFDIRYEDLVKDFEGTVHATCDFLGLPRQGASLDPAARARSHQILTVSAPQVARGLYDGSGQWRNYRAQLAPVLPILAPWVERFGYQVD